MASTRSEAKIALLSGGEQPMKATETQVPKPGDAVEIHGHRVGESARSGEILEVIGEPGHQHFRVRWEDGRESVVFPSSDAIVRSSRTPKRGTS